MVGLLSKSWDHREREPWRGSSCYQGHWSEPEGRGWGVGRDTLASLFILPLISHQHLALAEAREESRTGEEEGRQA